MTKYYGLKHSSGELLSLTGSVIIHDNPREMEFLIQGAPPVELPGNSMEEVAYRLGRPVLLLKDHPDFEGVRWPLDKRDFW